MDGFLGISLDLLIAWIGVLVGALAGIVALWVERDSSRKKTFAIAVTGVLLFTGALSAVQAGLEEASDGDVQEKMGAMLLQIDKISQSGDVEMPRVNDWVKGEIDSARRNSPGVIQAIAKGVAAERGDPTATLGSYLSMGELQAVARSGALGPGSMAGGAAADPKRKPMTFGDRSAQLRNSQAATNPSAASIAPAPAAAPTSPVSSP
jgi:hypothetical protein